MTNTYADILVHILLFLKLHNILAFSMYIYGTVHKYGHPKVETDHLNEFKAASP